MPKDLIRYDLLVQDALKGVVRKVMGDAAKDGLGSDHHFYVSFRTDFPGVRISNRLREKYPQDITIVLQHQFWDLVITEQSFEVGLSFSGVPEKLFVPFDALTGFFDPSVQFGLKFEVGGAEGGSAEISKPAASPLSKPAETSQKRPVVPVTANTSAPAALAKPARTAEKRPPPDKGEKPAKARPEAPPEALDPPAGGADVVSLDAFRKKN